MKNINTMAENDLKLPLLTINRQYLTIFNLQKVFDSKLKQIGGPDLTQFGTQMPKKKKNSS